MEEIKAIVVVINEIEYLASIDSIIKKGLEIYDAWGAKTFVIYADSIRGKNIAKGIETSLGPENEELSRKITERLRINQDKNFEVLVITQVVDDGYEDIVVVGFTKIRPNMN